MTNRVTIIEEMHQLAQAAVEKVTLDLTGEGSLSEKDFKMKFVQGLSEEVLQKGNQYGKISDGLFGLQDKLTSLGWEEVTPVDKLDEFVNYVDYARKVYINRIPSAYYAELFFKRFAGNLEGNALSEGIYKYSFTKGEERTHTPECGGGKYFHEYLVVERIDAMPEYQTTEAVSE